MTNKPFTIWCAIRGHRRQQKGVGKPRCETCSTLNIYEFQTKILIILYGITALIMLYIIVLKPQ